MNYEEKKLMDSAPLEPPYDEMKEVVQNINAVLSELDIASEKENSYELIPPLYAKLDRLLAIYNRISKEPLYTVG